VVRVRRGDRRANTHREDESERARRSIGRSTRLGWPAQKLSAAASPSASGTIVTAAGKNQASHSPTQATADNRPTYADTEISPPLPCLFAAPGSTGGRRARAFSFFFFFFFFFFPAGFCSLHIIYILCTLRTFFFFIVMEKVCFWVLWFFCCCVFWNRHSVI